MTGAAFPGFLRVLPSRAGRPALVATGLLLALATGFAVTGESLPAMAFVALTGGAGLLALAIVRPRVFLAILLPNLVLFTVFPLRETMMVSFIDVLLPIALVTTWTLTPRSGAFAAVEPVLARRRREFGRAAMAYFAVAVFSLVLLAARGGVVQALDSLSTLLRAIEAATFFWLVARHVRGPGDVRFVRNVVLGGVALAAVVNLPYVFFWGMPRAGSVLILNEVATNLPRPISLAGLPIVLAKPNELATACVLAWALLLALPPRRGLRLAGLAVSFGLLLATQSRSGLLSWATLLLVHGLGRGRRKLLLVPLVGLPLVAVLPYELQGRLLRTVAMEQGSFEVYSSVVRLFGWQTALEVFRHHPLFGVGYLGFRFVAHDYNALGMYFSTVENFFLETAVGMGILGLLVLSLFAIACWRLGRAARRHAEPGSQAHRLGEMTPAFLLSVFVANLTSDNLIGLVNGGQLAIFFALLAQASLLPACRRAGSGRP